jgi:hypothetical protein
MPQGPSNGPDTSPAHTTIYRPTGTLTVTAPPSDAGRSVAVDPDGTVVGRDATCELALASDSISRRHAIVRQRDGDYLIEDLGSTNGTLLNGERLAGVHPLHDGDRLTFADVEVEFRLSGAARTPRRSHPPTEEAWQPDASTAASSRVPDRPASLRHELHEAPGFSTRALLLAVGGSVVGTVLTTAVGTGPWGSLAGAALAPVVSTAFSTKRAGEKGRVRRAAIVILSLSALLITWAGVSLADIAAGRSVLPGADKRSNTFPLVPADGPTSQPNPHPKSPSTHTSAPSPRPIVEVGPVDCGTIFVGSSTRCPAGAKIRYNGSERLHVTSVEVTGQHAEDFTAGQECVDKWLDRNETCDMSVQFRPSAAERRSATLVIHQNLPAPDHGTEVALTGAGTDDIPTTNNPPPLATATARVSPTTYTGTCPKVFTFTGFIQVSGGPVTVRYKWIRSDGAITPQQTITFAGSGSQQQAATTTWTGRATGTQWQAIQILGPGSAQSNRATFSLTCQNPIG